MDNPVQPQGDENELQDVDRAQELQLQRSIVSEAPYAGGHGHGGYEKERHEDEQPEVGPPLHPVADQDFEHEQQQVNAHGDQHSFELHARLPLGAVARVSGPNARAHRCTGDDQELPQPYGGEDSPVAPLDDAVQAEGQQHREEQKAGVDEKLTRVEVLEQAPGVHGEAAARAPGPAARPYSAIAASPPPPAPGLRPMSALAGQRPRAARRRVRPRRQKPEHVSAWSRGPVGRAVGVACAPALSQRPAGPGGAMTEGPALPWPRRPPSLRTHLKGSSCLRRRERRRGRLRPGARRAADFLAGPLEASGPRPRRTLPGGGGGGREAGKQSVPPQVGYESAFNWQSWSSDFSLENSKKVEN